MKTLTKVLFTATAIWATVPGMITVPYVFQSDVHAAEIHTYVYNVWAFDLLRDPSNFGHHQVVINAASDQEAIARLNLHMSAWGDQLRNQGQHYNAMRSQFVSKS